MNQSPLGDDEQVFVRSRARRSVRVDARRPSRRIDLERGERKSDDASNRIELNRIETMPTTTTATTATTATRAGRWRRAERPARVVSRANAKDANDPFEALARAILPWEVNEARREMEYFDGAGGMFARANPWNAKPTIETPAVREGERGTAVIFDFETMGEERFERSFNALNDVVMGGASDCLLYTSPSPRD